MRLLQLGTGESIGRSNYGHVSCRMRGRRCASRPAGLSLCASEMGTVHTKQAPIA
jgi:hypothetical protein